MWTSARSVYLPSFIVRTICLHSTPNNYCKIKYKDYFTIKILQTKNEQKTWHAATQDAGLNFGFGR